MQIVLNSDELGEAAIAYATSQIDLKEGQTITASLHETEDGVIAVINIVKAEPEDASTKPPARRTRTAATAKAAETPKTAEANTQSKSGDSTAPFTLAGAGQAEAEKAAEAVIEPQAEAEQPAAATAPAISIFASKEHSVANPPASAPATDGSAVAKAQSLFANLTKPN